MIGIVYDLETTGLDTLNDRVIQLAMCIVTREENDDEWRIVSDFSSYVNPFPRRMSLMAQKVTKISPLEISKAPKFKDVWAAVCEFVTKHTIASKSFYLCGHNSKHFDDVMLVAELQRCGVDITKPFGDVRVVCIDTLQACRQRGGKAGLHTRDLKLSTLYEAATGGGTLDGAHDALVDCRGVVALLNWKPLQSSTLYAGEAWRIRIETFHERTRKRNLKKPALPPMDNKSDEAIASTRRVETTHGRKWRRLITSKNCLNCGYVYSTYFLHKCNQTVATHTR